jgi:Xaa-Pro aminopeptidase
MPTEVERYHALAQDAAAAMTDVLVTARPEWTGHMLAGASAKELWSRGIEPALILVGDEERLPRHRHPTPSSRAIGSRAMLVFSVRRRGLFANLTRFVYFRPPTQEERDLARAVAEVEAAALEASRPGTRLEEVFARIERAYSEVGHPGGERKHHQGGSCGYLSRDVIARPGARARLMERNAVAWNPSLPGAKIEDTVVVSGHAEQILTVDPRWPTVTVRGRRRPDLLVR